MVFKSSGCCCRRSSLHLGAAAAPVAARWVADCNICKKSQRLCQHKFVSFDFLLLVPQRLTHCHLCTNTHNWLMSNEKVAKSKSCKVWFDFVQFRQRENFEDSVFCIFATLVEFWCNFVYFKISIHRKEQFDGTEICQ